MILATLRAAGLAAITAATLIGCEQTTIANADTSGSSNDSTQTSQDTQGGGGAASSGAKPIKTTNTAPSAAALCVATAGSASGYTGSLASQISDPENHLFNFSVTQNPRHGSLQLDLTTGEFTYLPTTQSQGYLDSFSYRVDDLNGGSAEGTVKLIYGALRVMPLGDSITYGVTGYTSAAGDHPSRNFSVGYRQPLYEALVAEGYMVDFVGDQSAGSGSGLADTDHQGMPGWTSWQIGDAVGEWLNTNPADVVLAHVGTNDHKTTTDGTNFLLNNIHTWSANNIDTKVLLATIIDQHPDTFFEDTVEEFNSNLTQLVQDNWPDIDLVDQYSALNNQTDLTPMTEDEVGLHPTAGGYEKMAATWLDALKDSGSLHKCP